MELKKLLCVLVIIGATLSLCACSTAVVPVFTPSSEEPQTEAPAPEIPSTTGFVVPAQTPLLTTSVPSDTPAADASPEAPSLKYSATAAPANTPSPSKAPGATATPKQTPATAAKTTLPSATPIPPAKNPGLAGLDVPGSPSPAVSANPSRLREAVSPPPPPKPYLSRGAVQGWIILETFELMDAHFDFAVTESNKNFIYATSEIAPGALFIFNNWYNSPDDGFKILGIHIPARYLFPEFVGMAVEDIPSLVEIRGDDDYQVIFLQDDFGTYSAELLHPGILSEDDVVSMQK